MLSRILRSHNRAKYICNVLKSIAGNDYSSYGLRNRAGEQ